MLVAASSFFAVSNYIEAGLWFVVAAVVAVRYRLWRWRWLTAAALVAFGISDIVEVQTGAWWRPWWLLAWKTVCVVILVMSVADAIRSRSTRQ
jgi:hypothetical protein